MYVGYGRDIDWGCITPLVDTENMYFYPYKPIKPYMKPM